MISKLKALGKTADSKSSLEAECHSSEESNLITSAQESKSEKTISGGLPFCLALLKRSSFVAKAEKNDEIRKPLDPSASTKKRGRNPHSSPDSKDPSSKKTKGGSEKTPVQKQGSRSMVSNQNLRMFVQSRLDLYKNDHDKYNGIIRILADAGFLQFCYMLIKGKPGNMSKGTTKETLDGISYE